MNKNSTKKTVFILKQIMQSSLKSEIKKVVQPTRLNLDLIFFEAKMK